MKVKLSPFHSKRNYNVHVEFERQSNILKLTYSLVGEIEEVTLPSYRQGERQNQLWENTCFELFLSNEKSEEYLEFNISPAGDWNIYHFDGLRSGMKEETKASVTLFPPNKQSTTYTQTVEVNLEDTVFANSPLNIGITTVTRMNEEVEYWALVHPHHDRPDFHHPAGHILSC